MKRMRFRLKPRLIPSVLLVGAVLLGIKGTGLVLDAHAQEQKDQTAAAPGTSGDPVAANADPAADDADSSSAQVDVLTSLAKRRTELDARERDLSMRENLIAAAEKRVDHKISDLKGLQTEIEGLLQQRDDAEQKQLTSLVKTYASMPPKDAARIFDILNEDVLLSVAEQMKPADLAGVMAKMESEPAQKLTVRLAERLKLSKIQSGIAQTEVASTLPPAQGPMPAAGAAPQPAATAPESPPQPSTAPSPEANAPAPQTAPTGK